MGNVKAKADYLEVHYRTSKPSAFSFNCLIILTPTMHRFTMYGVYVATQELLVVL
ncbi:hypothetical protein [Lysinibacillus contaminans]|uniref:hypothetical protein n=1 Tax=Lysinibacillus contaminans TaxID=1293441 RepID=UPI000B2C8B1E|nr:hypothetical protein [Lysinibacillus contaminans]